MTGKKIRKKHLHVKRIASQSSYPAPDPVKTSDMFRSIEENGVVSRASMKSGFGNPCRHLERGVDVEKLSCRLAKSKIALTNCQDCAKDCKAAMGKKGKGRSMRKKLVQNHSFDNGTHQAMNWVCLACGHVGCGEISTSASAHWIEDSAKQNSNGPEKHEEGFPKGHSGKHALLAKHPMALQCGEKLVCWCFICNVVVDYASPLAASSEAPCEAEERQLEGLPSSGSAPLRQAAKLVGEKLAKERAISTNQGRFDHIDQPVTSLTDETPNPSSTECANLTPFLNGHCSFSRRKRLLKGLMNLGNTCFFNSVMQNLLALDMLRDYFSQDSKVVEGPLTSSLRLLYLETNPEMPAYGHTDVLGFESGLKRGGKGRMVWESTGGAYNPRSLFGAICAKAPRFRGYQQQDSHELLRCLLEGLNSEERSTGITEGESSITLMNSNRVSDIESREETEAADAERPIANTQIPNFVEFFFGGQLSSTVRCCECGHTSVVYEPVLDLSLQMQVSKKGQARANQGSSEKGPSHRVVKSTKAVKSPDWPDTPHPCSLVVSENNEVSAKIIPSASNMQNHSLAAENANTSSKEDASLDDCGWLDFVGGGIQSADGSLQGSIDSISSAQNSEDILNVDTEGSVHENILMEVLQPFPSNKCGSSDSTNHFESVGTEGIDESVATSCVVPAANNKHCPVKPLVDSSVMDAHRSVVMAPPILDEDVENKLLVAQTEEEEGPLPLAFGVLLLPYEQLQAPSITEGLESIQADTFNLDESSCSLEGEDKSTQLNLVLEDNGDFDGFSELFEEDETFTVKGKSIGVTRNFQVTEESYLHGSWDANTGPVVGGESGLRKGEPQKVFDHQDSILPMSLEGCLADFTKAELLSGENAWECESCAKCVKENASPLASNKDCNKPICNEEVIPKTVGDNSGNQVYHFLHRYDLNSVGKDVGGTSFNSNGNTSHMDYVGCSMTSCTTIGSNAPPMTVVDGLCSEILLACRSQASCNGTIEFSASAPKAGELVGGKVEANGRIGNGSARLNELDSGQLCGSGSPLRQRHNAESEPGNCSESLGEIPPTRLVSAEQVETGVAERWQTINQDGDGDDGDQSVHAGRPSAQSSERKHVQVDCISLGDVPPGTSSSTSEEKLPGPYRILGKPLKSQKYKKKKPQVENVKVVKRDATKRLLISKAPPILTIHLKRFAQDIRGRLNKLSGHVTFPLLLDLRPFLDSKCLDLDKCVYRLVGIVEHGGTMRGGHYVAYVRGPPSDEPDQESDLMEYERKSSWYYISDSSVHKSTLQAVLNSEAYLLFYEKYEVI